MAVRSTEPEHFTPEGSELSAAAERNWGSNKAIPSDKFHKIGI